MPGLSIIIPVYNTAAFLPQCLDSLLRQTFTDLEIICVDNNSTDNSLEILRQYAQKDSRLRVLQQPLPGQSNARNMGLDCATGDYIGFMDSDDEIAPQYYETLYRAALETRADVVCSGCQILPVGETPKPVQFEPAFVCTDWNTRWKIGVVVWSKIYKRVFLEQHAFRFAPGLTWEDVFWVLQILYKAHKMTIIPGNSYFYKYNPNSTIALSSTKNRAKTLYDIQEIFHLSQDFITRHEPNPYRRALLTDWVVDKLFYPWLVEAEPSLLHQISFGTRWRRKQHLLMRPHAWCCLEHREYHNQYYRVLRLFGFKIRLWKHNYQPPNF